MRVLLAPLGDPGFLYPAIAVGGQLRRRGARVWLLGEPRSAAAAAAAGLPLLASDGYGTDRAFRTHRWFLAGGEQYRATLRAARDVDPDVIVTTVLCLGALLAAERLDVPCVVVGLATHLWPYAAGGQGEDQSWVQREWRLAEFLRSYCRAAEEAGLPVRRARLTQSTLTGAALLLRGEPAWEYPGSVLPPGVHHVGSCWWEPPAAPNECADVLARLARVGKPVVYVHLGRTFGGESLWPRLNAMFTGGAYQALVERGRSGEPAPAPEADVVVVRKPWMGPLVAASRVVLTNATSAPVLGAVRYGRPLIVAPNGSEQPVLAAACIRTGLASRLPRHVHRGTLSTLIGNLAGDSAGDPAGDVVQDPVGGVAPVGGPVADRGEPGELAARIVESVASGRVLATA